MKTLEQRKEYSRNYYKDHKDHYNQKTKEWRNANPIQAKAIADRWLETRPHYQRDYQRKRKAIVEPLIFEFLDNGFDGDVDGFVEHLQSEGVPEQHIKYFKKDLKKYLPMEKN